MSMETSNILREIRLKSGKKLILRKPTVEDAEKMIEYCNLVGGESDNLTFGKDEFPVSIEQEKNFIKGIDQNPNALMVVGTIDDEMVTMANIGSLTKKRIAHNSTIGITVRKDYWRNGIASFVMEELIRFAKEHETIRNISLDVNASNEGAILLYGKFGFEKFGHYKDYFNINGKFEDKIEMVLYI